MHKMRAREINWRRRWQPTPVFLPGESQGRRSLVGCCPWGCRVGHGWCDFACLHALGKEMAAHSSVLAWRIPGTEEPGGLPSMGSHRVRRDWSDIAAAAAWTVTMKQQLYFNLRIRKQLIGQDIKKVPFYSQQGHGTSRHHLWWSPHIVYNVMPIGDWRGVRDNDDRLLGSQD